jgi:hypothetical protein
MTKFRSNYLTRVNDGSNQNKQKPFSYKLTLKLITRMAGICALIAFTTLIFKIYTKFRRIYETQETYVFNFNYKSKSNWGFAPNTAAF